MKTVIRGLPFIMNSMPMMFGSIAITRQEFMDKVPVLELNGTITSHSKSLVLAEVMMLKAL
ncbi:MAG: hypothetical protein JEZ12_21710 [Desulfobacterium sp.]|nr:hypothetical protein [Desulfobacterium sp.]